MSNSRLISIFSFLAIFLLLLVRQVSAQSPGRGPDPVPPTPSVGPVKIDPILLAKIEPQLLKNLLTADGDSVPFIVQMKTQADISGAVAAVTTSSQTEPDPLAKRRIIVDELQRTAKQSQTGVLQQLRAQPGLTGQAANDVRSLWIVNAVAARGTLETVLDLAARPDVDAIRLDKTIQLSRPVASDSQSEDQAGVGPNTPHEQLPEWGIEKIRADLVRNALGIDGSGVVVAGVDTGVDWLHPDLQSQYRGYTGLGKLPNHTNNWYDATNEGAAYPVDSQGHGTHTMGTAVGQNGIGVAPGARWIAVRAFDSSGTALDSWIHAAFQWLLAPAGDPALAPHVINNSWSSGNGWSEEFQEDIQILSDAGIFSVFAAGNFGPGRGTIGSPGSNRNAFSVGATNPDESIASFSGRGPSPWAEIKPEVSAPGTNVRSALPGGSYGTFNGTSMAAPHVTGLAALLLQAAPTLSSNIPALAEALTDTAVPLGDPVPNNDYGWGRVDTYSAVMSVTSAGTLSGVVRDATSGSPVATAVVKATPRLGGPTITTVTALDGSYLQGLIPGSYDVTVSAFGYKAHPTVKLDVLTRTETVQNFSLTPEPSGYVAGTVYAKSTGFPIAATIRVEGTPVSIDTESGQYRLKLPVGVYTVTAIAAEHRIASEIGVTVSADQTTALSFVLDSAPSILVVDSGKWYDESHLAYFGQALNDARYPYDVWQITNPLSIPTDLPPANTLQQYDVVIWSSPRDSPGYIGAGEIIEEYLDGGGKLMLSGQDIGFYDGQTFLSPYFGQYLKAKFEKDSSEMNAIVGVENGPFSSLSFTINDGDGANNQTFPDVIAVADPDFAGELLRYNDNNGLAGLYVGLWCLPYRAIYLSFGLEGISSRADRQAVMEDSMDFLLRPARASDIDLSPTQGTAIGDFSGTVSHTLRLRNTGTTEDVITLTQRALGPHFWPANTIPSPVTVPSCQSQYFTVTVQIPATMTWHISDTFTVAAQSGKDPALISVVTHTTKTPAPLLLVDDDRWYSFADKYKEALAANQIPHDFYFVPKSWSGVDPPSPSRETLQMYPMVVWYTAYDWFNPLTPNEEERLESYLDGGGRLLFSSQDFLFQHLQNHEAYQPFVQDYLGVQAHTEDYTSTLVLGEPSSPIGSYLGPSPLNFPAGYRNFSDGLTPTLKAQAATIGQRGQINGVTNAGIGSSGHQWRTNFLAYGAELISLPDRASLIRRATGWLSWLGDSQIRPETGAIFPGARITYTAVVSNNGWTNIASAHFTATLPAYLQPGSASPGVTRDDSAFLWSGPLAANTSHTFTFTAKVTQSLQAGTIISQASWLSYDEHRILFDRISTVKVGPELSGSSMHVTTPPARTNGVRQFDVLTYSIVLRNQGTMDGSAVTTTISLPPVLKLTGKAPVDSGAVISRGDRLTWTTALARNSVATLTFVTQVTTTGTGLIRNVALVDDGVNQIFELVADTRFEPGPIYLPIVVKNQSGPIYLPIVVKNQ